MSFIVGEIVLRVQNFIDNQIMRQIETIYIISIFALGNLFGREWVDVGNAEPSEPEWNVNIISESQLEVSFDLGGYFVELLPNGKKKITLPGGIPILEAGAPDLPRMARSIKIPDLAHMEISILESEYMDIDFEDLSSSKGNLLRNVDPSSILYTYGKAYQTDKFYPDEIVFLREPYVMRNTRGQSIVFQPIQFNPIQRKLRVFKYIKIFIKENGISNINPLTRRPNKGGSREFENIYSEHFLNYQTTDRYEPLDEHGPMLIISHGEFMDEMQAFIDWKNYKGIPTEIVDVANVGGVSDMEQFIADKYYEDGIAYVLLVGDIAQIESIRRSNGNGSNSPSDNSLTFISGNDAYPELFIGRFSAETGIHVETMVNRTIAYEMEPDPMADWYKKGSGFASDQGPGDDGEYDDEHLNNIRDQLLNYTYMEIDQIYDPSGTVADGEAALNEGRSIINYTGHGSNGSWGNGCPMNQTDVNGLVNIGMYPFIWSVACVNGEFHIGTCFAETWLRATASDGTPIGAVATLMSTVNQGWNPPMEGQDEMNAILVESYENNIKRTFGGLSFNGMLQMNDSYGSAGYNETYYWTCFGDPSVVVRTDTPTDMNTSHNGVMIIGATEFSIETGESGALVAISRDGELLGSTYTDGSGAATINFDTPLDVPGSIDLVVTGYNKIPYETAVNVIAPDGAYLLMGDIAVNGGSDQILDFGETGYLYVTFENVGQDSSGDLTFSLSHDGDMVDMNNTILEHTSIAAGEEVTIGPFEFMVSWNVENGSIIPFILNVTDGNETWEYETNIPVEAPEFNLLSVEFMDMGNGTLDPGESTTMQLVLNNLGNAPLNYPTFIATTSDPNITLGTVTSDNAYLWEINGNLSVTVDLTASNDAPIGHTALVGLVIGSSGTDYENVFPVPITLGLLIEDFESENFTAFDWIHSGDNEWSISSNAYSGSYSAQSGDINDGETSELAIEMNILYEGEISFWAKSSSEQGASGSIYDYLTFFINDEPVNIIIGGETDWTEYTINIPVGMHTLRWVYMKDGAQSAGQDCAWIDRIVFPAGSVPPLNIDFGDTNLDGLISIFDVIYLVNYVVGNVGFTFEQVQNADMNLDGIVNLYDVLLIVDAVLNE